MPIAEFLLPSQRLRGPNVPIFRQNFPRISLLLVRMTVDNTHSSACVFKFRECVARDQRQNDIDKQLEETCSGRVQF